MSNICLMSFFNLFILSLILSFRSTTLHCCCTLITTHMYSHCAVYSLQVRNESDPALALLSDYIENKSVVVRTASVCGLGIAYSGESVRFFICM